MTADGEELEGREVVDDEDEEWLWLEKDGTPTTIEITNTNGS
ncbi:hypothetical protein QA600_07480 [Natronococcus sp. A-GB1]|nr:hypothetical protein [Natronococcus sp. A-GB1]MDG5759181.1 hypothetical protein [Natronococcus sp. A-GB1]